MTQQCIKILMKADSMNESVLPEALQRRDRGGIGFPLTALLFSSPPAEPLRPDSNHYEFLKIGRAHV